MKKLFDRMRLITINFFQSLFKLLLCKLISIRAVECAPRHFVKILTTIFYSGVSNE